MSKIAIITDSNSGITQNEAKELGIIVVAMPFTIDGEEFLEDITLSQEQFYEKMLSGGQVKTSQPSPETIMELWNKTLEEYDEIVHIPMSSGLSGACQTALMLSEDYDGKVAVVDNQRISVTQKSSVFDAMKLAKKGLSAAEIRDKLMEDKFESSIYIMMDTLSYLKTGGRLTGAVAALGTLLKIKPVLQIQGEKLDAFSVARTHNQAKNIMMNQIAKDFTNRFKVPEDGEGMRVFVAYTYNRDAAEIFFEEIKERFPKAKVEYMDALSLSVSCHIGPGALAIACARDSFAE
ncbi:MAG: DegV family protein [Lachnospiraceae bacterium]|nr:DegV family protein [Lachnospiraceae bacterium]